MGLLSFEQRRWIREAIRAFLADLSLKSRISALLIADRVDCANIVYNELFFSEFFAARLTLI